MLWTFYHPVVLYHARIEHGHDSRRPVTRNPFGVLSDSNPEVGCLFWHVSHFGSYFRCSDMKRPREQLIWRVSDVARWESTAEQQAPVEYLVAIVTQAQSVEGVNKAGQPYKLLKLVLEDQSYAGTVTCAVWDEAAQAYLKKLTLPVVIGLSNLVVSQWQGCRQVTWRKNTRLHRVEDRVLPSEELRQRLSELHKWRTGHQPLLTDERKPGRVAPLAPVSEQGTPGASGSGPAGLGPLTVAEALDRMQRGTGGTCVKVRAHVLKVEVGVTGVDPADAGYGDLIECVACGIQGGSPGSWRYRAFHLWLSDDDEPSVRGRAGGTNNPGSLKEASSPLGEAGGSQGGQAYLEAVRCLLSSLSSAETGKMLFRLRRTANMTQDSPETHLGQVREPLGEVVLEGVSW